MKMMGHERGGASRSVGRRYAKRRIVLLGLSVLMCLSMVVAPVNAGKSHFSGITIDGQTVPVSALKDSAMPEGPKADDTHYIDLVVSVYKKTGDDNYPAGDDDGGTQGNAGSEEQDKIEKIFKYMAHGLYEASEGKQKLRNVRIYTKGERAADADIVWTANGSVCASVSGIDGSGGHIYMSDTGEWYNADGSVRSTYDFIGDQEGSGYTLAHEMGHYYYGVWDEYALAPTDVVVDKAIMNSQWGAVGGNYKWLNFSVKWRAGLGEWVNTKLTAQHRKYAESCWETIARNPASDAKPGDLVGSFKRHYYAGMAGAAPAGLDKPTVDLTGSKATTADAESDLKVIWVTGGVVYQIVLDRSGSMSGSRIANAKLAAANLVTLAEIDNSQVGIVIFDDDVDVLEPITPIDSEATKERLRQSIAGIYDSGSTAIGDAANVALQGLNALGTTKDTKVVFLLSDGQSNSGVNPLSVIPDYQNAQVPIYAFVYGAGADQATLSQMASGTGGQVFASPTTLEEVSAAFQVANESAAGTQGLASGEGVASPVKAPTVFPFQIDSTVGRLDLTVVHSGQPSDATVIVTAGNGVVVSAAYTDSTSTDTLLNYSVDLPAVGQWTISAEPTGMDDIDVSYRASAAPHGAQYALSVESTGGSTIDYPAPMVVVAALEKDLPINSAEVNAVLTDPAGSESILVLLDDGVAPDEIANDGRYTGIVLYEMEGLHTVEVDANNAAGTAKLTTNGTALTAPPSGISGAYPPDKAVGENFQRQASAQITVSNMFSDDHGDDRFDATPVEPDNSDTPGRIDYGADIDFFSFLVPGGTTTLSARVSGLAGGMEPKLKLYDTSGTVLDEATRATTKATQGGYVLLTIGVTPTEEYYASVEDTMPGVEGGLYQFSVGPGIASDDVSGFSLTMSKQGDGTVTPEVGAHTYDEGEVVALEATPAEGWRFKNWEGAVGDTTSAKTSITMDQDQDVTAVFVKQYVLTVKMVGEGTVSPAPGSHSYDTGEVVALKATPAEGWRFEKWKGSVDDTASAKTSVTMDKDQDVTAVFVKLPVLTIEVVGNGTVDPAAGSHSYDEGKAVTITATPAKGWTLRWEGELPGGQDPEAASIVITMDADKLVRVVFEEKGFFSCGAAGSSSGGLGGDLFVILLVALGLLACSRRLARQSGASH